MANDLYTPQTWADGVSGGTPLTAQRLNKIETGIDTVDAAVQALSDRIGAAADPASNASQQTDTGRVKLLDLGDVSGAIVLDLQQASAFKLRLTGPTSVQVIGWSPLQSVQEVPIYVKQDFIGGRALAWPGVFALDATIPSVPPVADTLSIYTLLSADQGAIVMVRYDGAFRVQDRYDNAVSDLYGLGYYLPLTEASGTVAADTSGQGRDGTYGGSLVLANTATVPSSSRKAPRFGGAGYVTVDSLQVAKAPSAAFTFGFTVVSTDPGTNRVELYAETLSTDNNTGVLFGSSGQLLADGRAQARFEVTDAAGNQQVYRTLSASIFDNRPHVVVVTGDGQGAYAIYVDGVLDQSWAPASPAAVTVDRTTWGARRSSATSRYLADGAIGRVFTRTVLTSLQDAAGLWAAFQTASTATTPGGGGGTSTGGGTSDGYDANGVKMGTPVVSVSGQTVTFTCQIQTNRSVTFTHLQLGIRGPGTVNGATATSPGAVVNGTVTLTGTVTFTQYGTGQVVPMYALVANPAVTDWKEGAAASFTVAAPVTTPPTGGGGGGGGGGTTTVTAFLDGVSGTATDTAYASWLGHVPSIAGTWCETKADQVNLPSLRAGAEYGTWARPIDVSIGAIYKADGETWAAAAAGTYDARWTQCLNNLKTYWGTRDPRLLYIRFAHGFNLAGRPWSVSGSEASAFQTAWRRFRTLQKQILATANLVWCPNDGTSSSLSLDVRNAWPGADNADVVGIDTFNAYPWVNTQADFTSKINLVNSYGAPVGAEKWRLQAQSWGKPLAICEWANRAVAADASSGGGDSPTFIQLFGDWLKANAGAGSGQVLYAIYYNLSSTYQVYPVASQPNASAKYKEIFGAMTSGTGSGSTTVTGGTTTTPTTPTTPAPAAPSGGYPVKAISLYAMMWSSNGPALSTFPTAANVVRMAFAQGSPPTMVGWKQQGQASFVAEANAAKARGVKFIVSVGGSGGAVNTSNRTAFLQGIANINNILALDGLDWDIEASSLNQSDVLYLSTQLKKIYGANFAITFAPNGGNVSQYLPAAVACHQAGALDEYGQQFYDAPVSLSAAKGRIDEAIRAGLPASKISVGMMIGSGSNYWTNAVAKDNMAAIRAQWPGITKAYLWEVNRSGTSQWVSDMVQVIG